MLGYMGPDGTFSHQAAVDWSNGREELKCYHTIYSLILAVDRGEVEKAIVPIENSIEGSVNMTLDTLAFESDVFITGEYILNINENLMVKREYGEKDIKKIISHPQPIGQCSKMLSHDFSEVQIEFADSTAAAAKMVAESDGTLACIGAAQSAELYGLDIVRENCGDEENNSTRFVIIEKKQSTKVSGRDKTSIAFAAENKPGCLYKALELFMKSNINMTKIESRPMKKELGRYIFFIDIEGNIDDATIYFALDKLRQNTSFYKFLGSYAY